MICQSCQKNQASVHITEIVDYHTESARPLGCEERHLCEQCADFGKLPLKPVIAKKSAVDIWKLLKQSARRNQEVSCGQCGMGLREFRSRGRLGCPQCYEAFARHLTPILHRMHNSVQHAGRLPGMDARELERQQQLHQLEQRLASAVREEAYESAAQLRDQIEALRDEDPGESEGAPQAEQRAAGSVETAQLDPPREDETA